MNTDKLTKSQYDDAGFAQAFRRRRGDHPRAYERRLLRQLLAAARARRFPESRRRPLLVLDVGTGYGRDLAWLQARQGIRAFGIDYSMAMLRAGRSAVRLRKGTVAQMDATQLGIRDASVDVVRAQAVFHHFTIRAAQAAMREIARIARPGGLVRVFVRYGRFCGLRREPELGPRYFRYFTLRALSALLRRNGLRLLRHELVRAQDGMRCLAILAEKPAS